MGSMELSLWQRIRRIVFGKTEEEQNESSIPPPMKKGHVQLSVYEYGYEGGPLAQVRYTSYGPDGRVVNVEQVDYGYEANDLHQFDVQTTTALEMGVDVTIFTKADIELFPKLSQYTKL